MTTAETIQDAMHREGLKTYEELQAENEQYQRDVKRLELHLDIENVNKRGAWRLADRYQWRYKLWLTVAITTWVAVIAWRVWGYIV
jgi:hypothetical protein